jgi:hypothetical protein
MTIFLTTFQWRSASFNSRGRGSIAVPLLAALARFEWTSVMTATRLDFEELSALLKPVIGRPQAVLIPGESFVIVQRFIFNRLVAGPLQGFHHLFRSRRMAVGVGIGDVEKWLHRQHDVHGRSQAGQAHIVYLGNFVALVVAEERAAPHIDLGRPERPTPASAKPSTYSTYFAGSVLFNG